MEIKVNNKESMRIGNYMQVLQLIREAPASRISLSKTTKLTQPTIGNITNQMLSDGIINEIGKQASLHPAL